MDMLSMSKIITSLKINSEIDKVVVVDPGKNAVKVLVFNTDYELQKVFDFPSKSKIKRNFSGIDSGSEYQFKVEFEGVKYMVGEGISDGYNFETTKNNLHHKLCIYTAIASVINKPNERIHLLVGYPSSDYSNDNQKQDYANLISSNSPVSMILNNEYKTFNIESVSIFPEGIALKPRIKHKRRVHVIDIGGQNINYREYDEKGNTLNSYSLDSAGINYLEGYIRTELRRFVKADKVNVETIDLISAIKQGKIIELNNSFLTNYKDSTDFIQNTVFEFINGNILNRLMSKGDNLSQRGNFIIFTGGGSLLLRDYLTEVLENNRDNMYFSETAKWDNCISYTIKDIGDRCKNINKRQEAQLVGQYILEQLNI